MAEEDLDLDGSGQGYSGTFRWKSSKKLPSMSPPDNSSHTIFSSDGWMSYFLTRVPNHECGELISLVRSDLSFIDCLSTPCSIAYMLEETIFSPQDNATSSLSTTIPSAINIVCIGCASKAEERVLRETNCYLELVYYLLNKSGINHVNLWLIGPEISTTKDDIHTGQDRSFTANLFKGTSLEFFRKHSNLLHESSRTIVVGLNCGFGNFENPLPKRFELLFEWLPDLYFLTGTKLPLFFTCANDYADQQGELTVMKYLLGAKLVIARKEENPFGYASTLVSSTPDTNKGTRLNRNHVSKDGYSRGNSYWYGVQGFDKDRRVKFDVKSATRVDDFTQWYQDCCKKTKEKEEDLYQPLHPIVFHNQNSIIVDDNSLAALEELVDTSVASLYPPREPVHPNPLIDEVFNNRNMVVDIVSPPPLPTPPSPSPPPLHPSIKLFTQSKEHLEGEDSQWLSIRLEMTSVESVSLSVADNGDMLLLSLPSATAAGEFEEISISVEYRIESTSISAKISKKKGTLQIRARLLYKDQSENL